jgi:transposase InsO family protein
MMLDQNICAVSSATTWRVLKSAGLMQGWATAKTIAKGRGFTQPAAVNEHWHIDISMIKVQGIHYNLISVLDGFSRKIVNHELRVKMEYVDVAIVLQQAAERCPDATPRIISDNGGQFVAKDFKELINHLTYTHVRTSLAYPQSNGKIERYHGTIKSEAIRKQSYLDLQDARQQIAGYIKYYNTERLHSAINFLAPQDVVDGRTDEILNERDRKLFAARQRRRQAA